MDTPANISVIIPVFNGEKVIGPLLESLTCWGSKGRDEIIVIDNSSTDNTVKVIKTFPWVHLIHQDKIPNSYATRNAGIRAASGDGIVFIDADVVTTPGWLDALFEGWEDETIGCFVGEVKPYSDKTLVERFCRDLKYLEQRKALIAKPPMLKTVNCAFRRKVFEEVGSFDEDVISGGDSLLFHRMLATGKWTYRYNPHAVVLHRNPRTVRELLKKAVRTGASFRTLTRSPFSTNKKNEFGSPKFSGVLKYSLYMAGVLGYRLITALPREIGCFQLRPVNDFITQFTAPVLQCMMQWCSWYGMKIGTREMR